MALTQVDFDDVEEEKIGECSFLWKLNKPKTVRRMIKEFGEVVDNADS